jgi:DNA-binding transcriptional ArsR family regulator
MNAPSTRVEEGSDTESRNVLGIGDDGTEEVLNSVASETARDVLASVRDEGKTPAELSERFGTSTQNIRYHLGKLETAGLVEVNGIRYSEKGREMSVYEGADSPPVVVIGSLDEAENARGGGGDQDAGENDAEDDSGERVTRFDTEDESRDTARPSARPGKR